MSKRSKFAMMCTVAILILCGMDASGHERYGFAALYLLCVSLFIAIWRIGLRTPTGYPRWLGFLGTNILLIGFLDAWTTGNRALIIFCLFGAILNIPAIIEKKSVSKN